MPLVALVVGQSFFVDNFSHFVDCVLVLGVHWCEEKFWDLHCFAEGEGDAVTMLDILLDQFTEEDGVVGGALVVTKFDGFLDIGDP